MKFKRKSGSKTMDEISIELKEAVQELERGQERIRSILELYEPELRCSAKMGCAVELINEALRDLEDCYYATLDALVLKQFD